MKRLPSRSLVASLAVACLASVPAAHAAPPPCGLAPASCQSLCDDDDNPATAPTPTSTAPIRILYLGGSAFPSWLTTSLTQSNDDCSHCALVAGVDYIPSAVPWAVARTWLPEQFRAYDVIVVDSTASSVFPGPLPTDPWLPIMNSARRSVTTGMHVDGNNHMASNGFREFNQNVVAWLAKDECCERLSGEGRLPGIYLVESNVATNNPFTYSPWPCLAKSATRGPCSAYECSIWGFDDTVITVPHPIFASVHAEHCDICGASNQCTLDDVGQSVHLTWQAGTTPCGFEDEGWVSVQEIVLRSDQCTAITPSCIVMPPDGKHATLVRNLDPKGTCCREIEPAPHPSPITHCDP